MKKLLLALLIFCCTAAVAQTKDELAVRQLLAEQVKGWNKGNINNFMKGYWQSDSLLFIGKNGPQYGYQTTLDNYKKSYPDNTAMGKLSFDLLQVKRLSPGYFFVVGKWHLTRTIGDAQGHFTLLIRRVKDKWLVVVDHSS